MLHTIQPLTKVEPYETGGHMLAEGGSEESSKANGAPGELLSYDQMMMYRNGLSTFAQNSTTGDRGGAMDMGGGTMAMGGGAMNMGGAMDMGEMGNTSYNHQVNSN